MAEPAGQPTQPERALGLTSATALVVGSMIGSGILLLPATMLGHLPSPPWVLAVFVVAALLTIAGALTVAELSGMMPGPGGQYLYLREAFGDLPAYLFGWTTVWIVQTGTVAAVAAAFVQVLARFVDLPGQATPLVLGGWGTGITLPPWGQAYAAVGLVAALSLVNWLGVRFGGLVQNVSTFAKFAGLALVVLLVFGFADPSADAFQPFTPQAPGQAPLDAAGLAAGFLLALSLCLFMYDGWYAATYVAAEVKDPRRNVPLALVLGPLATTAVYLAVAGASLYAVPLEEALRLPAGDYLAGHAATSALGEHAGTLVTLLALVSIFGTVNAYVLTSPRVGYAFAKDGWLLRGMARLHPRRGTPGYGLLLSGIWSCLLVFTGLYDQLANMVIFAVFVFHVPTALALFALRRRRPEAERPFRTPAAPVVAGFYLVSSLVVVAAGLLLPDYQAYSLLATLVVLSGVPAWFIQRGNAARRRAEAALP